MSDHDWRARQRAAIKMIEGWLADESGYDERVWPELQKALGFDQQDDRGFKPEDFETIKVLKPGTKVLTLEPLPWPWHVCGPCSVVGARMSIIVVEAVNGLDYEYQLSDLFPATDEGRTLARAECDKRNKEAEHGEEA